MELDEDTFRSESKKCAALLANPEVEMEPDENTFRSESKKRAALLANPKVESFSAVLVLPPQGMEQERFEEITEDPIDSKSKSIPYDMETESVSSKVSLQTQEFAGSKYLADDFASPTPTKKIQASRCKNKQTGLSVRAVKLFSKEYQNEDGDVESESELPDDITGYEEIKSSDAKTNVENVEIPDKYKPLAELFDRLNTSIRLLSLRKKEPTFQNICTVVKVLTPRIFAYSHLAQMKYLLPEAIHIEKILTHDEKTLCMMPDMKIILLLDVVEANPNQSAFMGLRQVFYQRLVDFCNNNSESCEIPEAMLPEPFGQKDHTLLPKPLPVNSSIESHPSPIEYESMVSSPSGQSIKKHFSHKMIVSETEKTQLLASLVSPISVETDLKMRFSPQKDCSLVSESAFNKPPTAPISGSPCSNSSASESLPVEFAPLPCTVTVETPAKPAPAKRVSDLSSCEKMNSEARILSHMAAKRSLTFGKSEEYTDSFHQTAETQSILVDDNVEENINRIKTQTGPLKRQQMLASLTNLIYTIERIFKSAKSSLITKEELLQKIIAYDLDIVDIREVEEQLELLEELVPDWILRKWVPSGDLFYSIRRVSDLELILTRLSKAV